MATTTMVLRQGTVMLTGGELGFGTKVMYATVEDGVVTAVTFGNLPSSTETIYYVDLSSYATQPAVGWYFSDVCQTFSALPPVIPAGDLAPPFTPGSPPPVPGDPDYPNPEIPTEDDPVPLASTAPVWISFHADAEQSATIAGGADYVEVDERMRTTVRINDVCAVRIQTHVITEDAGLQLFLCYRNELDEWEPLSVGKTGPSVTLAAADTVAGMIVNIDPAIAGDTTVTVCAKGTGSAVVGNISGVFFFKTTDGVCLEIEEGVGCGLQGFPERGTDFSFADYDALYAARNTDDLFTTWRAPTTEDPNFAELLIDAFGPYFALHHGKGGTNRTVGWQATGFGLFDNNKAVMLVTALDPNLAAATSGTGLILFRWTTGYGNVDLQLRSGRMYIVGCGSTVDVGPAADLCDGTPKQIIMDVSVFSDGGLSRASANVYLDEPCLNAMPTFYGSATSGLTIGTITPNITALDIAIWDGTEREGDQSVYLYAISGGSSDFNG